MYRHRGNAGCRGDRFDRRARHALRAPRVSLSAQMAGRRSADVGQYELDAPGDMRLRPAGAAPDAPYDGYRNGAVLAGLVGDMPASQGGAGGQRSELADRGRPTHRRHAAIGAREQPLCRDEAERLLDGRGYLLRLLDPLVRDIDRAEQNILSGEQAERLDRHLGARALDRDLVDPAR